MLESIVTHKHPSCLGPMLIHQRKDFSAFNYFASTLVNHDRKLKHIKAFGTDGDPALIEAFSHNFPDALQLRCFIHLKRNTSEKLNSRFSNSVIQEYLADIFGKTCGNTYQEGLVDSKDAEDFNDRLEACKETWRKRESLSPNSNHSSFFEYFSQYYAQVIRHSMLKDVRTVAGLGYPPSKFSTNTSESINAVMKRKVDYKETSWPEYNDSMKELVQQQRDEVLRSLSGSIDFVRGMSIYKFYHNNG